MRETFTTKLVAQVAEGIEQDPEPLEQTLSELDVRFLRPHLDRRFHGLYHGGPLTRVTSDPEALRGEVGTADREDVLARIDGLYPDSLADRMEELTELGEESSRLQALLDGVLEAPSGIIEVRGERIHRRELPQAAATAKADFERARADVFAHFCEARGAHLAAARLLPGEWEATLTGLGALLHYSEHCGAAIEDAGDFLQHVLAIVFADGNVSSSERKRVLKACEDVHETLGRVHKGRLEVLLPEAIATDLELENGFTDLVPEALITYPTMADLGEGWIEDVQTWVVGLTSRLRAVTAATRDTLLQTEDELATWLRDGTDPGPAPAPAMVPAIYPKLAFGAERRRQKRLSLWDRFQLADGPAGATLRFGAAACVLVPTLAVTWTAGTTTLVAHNGLPIPVVVEIDGTERTLQPDEHTTVTVSPGELALAASTTDGEPIEAFTETVSSAYLTPIYNVAQGSGLVKWTAVYADYDVAPAFPGAPRFVELSVDHAFTQPPLEDDEGSTRTVVEALTELDLTEELGLVDDEEQRVALATAHATWAPSTDDVLAALWHLDDDHAASVIASRLEQGPDLRLQRYAMDIDHDTVCADLAGSVEGADPGRAYLAARCMKGAGTAAAVPALLERFPDDPWIAYLAAMTTLHTGDLDGALERIESHPELFSYAELDLPVTFGRYARMVGTERADEIRSEMATRSPRLQALLAFEVDPVGDTEFEQWVAAVHRGEPPSAADLANLPEAGRTHLVALAALSAGASSAQREAAAALDPSILHPAALLGLMGQAQADGRDLTAYREAAVPLGVRIDDLDTSNVTTLLDDRVVGTSPATRAGLRLYGLQLAGTPPAHWRDEIEALLFMHERPLLR